MANKRHKKTEIPGILEDFLGLTCSVGGDGSVQFFLKLLNDNVMNLQENEYFKQIIQWIKSRNNMSFVIGSQYEMISQLVLIIQHVIIS